MARWQLRPAWNNSSRAACPASATDGTTRSFFALKEATDQFFKAEARTGSKGEREAIGAASGGSSSPGARSAGNASAASSAGPGRSGVVGGSSKAGRSMMGVRSTGRSLCGALCRAPDSGGGGGVRAPAAAPAACVAGCGCSVARTGARACLVACADAAGNSGDASVAAAMPPSAWPAGEAAAEHTSVFPLFVEAGALSGTFSSMCAALACLRTGGPLIRGATVVECRAAPIGVGSWPPHDDADSAGVCAAIGTLCGAPPSSGLRGGAADAGVRDALRSMLPSATTASLGVPDLARDSTDVCGDTRGERLCAGPAKRKALSITTARKAESPPPMLAGQHARAPAAVMRADLCWRAEQSRRCVGPACWACARSGSPPACSP